jgi:hypothetical protein
MDPGFCGAGVVDGWACCAIAGKAKIINAIMTAAKIRRAEVARSIRPEGSQVCIKGPPKRFTKLGVF